MSIFRRKHEDRAVEEELQAHLDEHIEELVESGMTEAEARRVARTQLGNRTRAQERIHEENGFRVLDAVAGDLRFALRMIRFRPWFSIAVITVMAFGIGTNTAVFSLVNAVLFKPLPYKSGDRIVTVTHRNLRTGFGRVGISYPDYLEYRAGALSFESLEAYWEANWDEGFLLRDRVGDPQLAYDGARVTPGFLDMLGVLPVQGRGFQPSDADAASDRVLLISAALWRDRYGMAGDVVGRRVVLSGEPATIIGIMPEKFSFPGRSQIWTPLINTPLVNQRTRRILSLVGVRKPGVSIEAARADLSVISRSLAAEFPLEDQDIDANVTTVQEQENGGDVRILFLLLQGAVTFVLFIACANVANMILSRVMNRQREFSVRAALGASSWKMIRQLLVESVLLSVAGGAIGLVLSNWATRTFDAVVVDRGKPSWLLFEMDYTAYAYFAGLCVVSGMLFGLFPAIRASRANLTTPLKEGSRDSGSRRAGFLSSALVVLQLTLAIVLLVGGGLFVQELRRQSVDVNRLPLQSVLIARIGLPNDRYPDATARNDFYDRLLAKTRTIPGASQAAVVSSLPTSLVFSVPYQAEGKADVETARPRALQLTASPGYFSLLDLPIRAGRVFDDRDGKPGRESVIVTSDFADQVWPGQSPIGKRIRFFQAVPTPPGERRPDRPGPWLTVVGVSGGLKQDAGQVLGVAAGPDLHSRRPPLVFLPYSVGQTASMWMMLRSSGDPSALTKPLRSALQQIDSELALYDVQTLAQFIDSQTWFLKVFGIIFLIFATGALTMAAIGIYAVATQSAARRTREMGIRLALGASSAEILSLALSRGVKQLLIGLILGSAVAAVATQLMQSILTNISPFEPVVLGVVLAIIAAVGLTACWIPARRTISLDPTTVLREE